MDNEIKGGSQFTQFNRGAGASLNTNLTQQPMIKVNTKQLGPSVMRDKLKHNLEESRIEDKKRPPSGQRAGGSKANSRTRKDNYDDDDKYSEDGYDDFEDDKDGGDEDQVEKLKKAMEREKKKALQF